MKYGDIKNETYFVIINLKQDFTERVLYKGKNGKLYQIRLGNGIERHLLYNTQIESSTDVQQVSFY